MCVCVCVCVCVCKKKKERKMSLFIINEIQNSNPFLGAWSYLKRYSSTQLPKKQNYKQKQKKTEMRIKKETRNT